MSDYIFNKDELKNDLEELYNLESQPNVESDSILYERLEYLRWKVDKSRQYLMDYSIDIDWNILNPELKSSLKKIKDLDDKERDYQINLLVNKIAEHGFNVTNNDVLKYMYYLEFFEGFD